MPVGTLRRRTGTSSTLRWERGDPDRCPVGVVGAEVELVLCLAEDVGAARTWRRRSISRIVLLPVVVPLPEICERVRVVDAAPVVALPRSSAAASCTRTGRLDPCLVNGYRDQSRLLLLNQLP